MRWVVGSSPASLQRRRRRSGSGQGRPSSCRDRQRSRRSIRAGGRSRARLRRAGRARCTKRSPSGPWSVAPSPRTASEIRKPSRPLSADDRGRVELGELEVGEHRSGVAGEQQARSRTSRAGWSCATTARRRRRWRGSWRGRRALRPSSSRTPPCRRIAGRAVAFEDRRFAGARRRRRRAPCRILRPVALPPAWMIRRRLWPPSRPSARSPWRSASNWTPSSIRSVTRAAASSVRTSAAARRVRPRPATSVSSRCSRGESSIASAAAAPPCAQ